ncbi:MAG: sialidase family protein [Bacteroidota bacterium]
MLKPKPLLLATFWIAFSVTYGQSDLSKIQAQVTTNEQIFANPPFQECHASSLVELSNGNIMAVWFGGTREKNPDVTIWGSTKTEAGWSEPAMLADGVIDENQRYACWNPVLFQTKEGELFLFYKVGLSPREWWGEYKTSSDDGATWSDAVKLPQGILGPIRNKPIYLTNGDILSGSSVETNKSWHAHMELSRDQGRSWSKIPLDTTTGYKIIQPTLLTLEGGEILTLMRSNQGTVVESRSTDQGKTWSVPAKSKLPNPNSGIDAVTLSNGLHLLVYNPHPGGGRWVEGRAKLNVAISNNGTDWIDIHKLEDNEEGEYSYPAVIEAKDGSVHITYTDDRKNVRYVVLELVL